MDILVKLKIPSLSGLLSTTDIDRLIFELENNSQHEDSIEEEFIEQEET